MWKHYFGPQARIYGVDVNPRCREFEDAQTEILIGDQEDRAFLKRLKRTIPRLDIVIDDGGHTMKQQIVTFEELFPHVSDRGLYLCEDTSTSYWRYFGGGYKRKGTFVEFSKDLVDSINAWFSKDDARLAVNSYTEWIQSLHFYAGILVVEKQATERPVEVETGSIRLPVHEYINPLHGTLPFSVRSVWRKLKDRFQSCS